MIESRFPLTSWGGRACIRGMRITVSLILTLIANGMTVAEVVEAYPYVELEDIQQSLQYAALLAEDSIVQLRPAA